MQLRKVVIHQETVFGEAGRAAARPVLRVAAMAMVRNPFAGRFVEDLTELYELGGRLGQDLMTEVVGRLRAPPESYGKAALVGALGDFEHGGACIHPRLGKPMRAAVGGGKAVVPSNVKVGPPGSVIDVPLGHKDEAWSFDHFDTLSLSVADSPRPDEIMIIMAVADGGRVNPRCGSGPLTD